MWLTDRQTDNEQINREMTTFLGKRLLSWFVIYLSVNLNTRGKTGPYIANLRNCTMIMPVLMKFFKDLVIRNRYATLQCTDNHREYYPGISINGLVGSCCIRWVWCFRLPTSQPSPSYIKQCFSLNHYSNHPVSTILLNIYNLHLYFT